MLDLLPDPVIACDTSGRVALWSSAAQRAYGFAADEALGQTAAELLSTRFPAPEGQIAEAVANVGHWRGRLRHRARDGRELEVECHWLARRDPSGRPVGDLRIERLLDPGAADSGEIRRIAHELNNALAIVVNYGAFAASALRREAGERDVDRRRASLLSDIEQVNESAERAAQLSGRLAELARGAAIATPEAARPDADPGPHAPATILVVDDERPLRELCRGILSDAGYEVLEAADGREALRLAQRHDGPIDLLLTDVVMPEMRGHQVASRLRELRPTTAIAYMSGFPDVAPGVVEQVRGALIDKPFTAPALLEHVRSALGSSGAQPTSEDEDGEGPIHGCRAS